jgi:hypothetical protein
MAFDLMPTAPGSPQLVAGGAGVRTNQFGFYEAWTNSPVVVVEVCTDLINPSWTPITTNTLNGGSLYFADSQWTNHPYCYYLITSP